MLSLYQYWLEKKYPLRNHYEIIQEIDSSFKQITHKNALYYILLKLFQTFRKIFFLKVEL